MKTLTMKKDEVHHTVLFSAHIGASMNPTLCALDLLEILPYGERPVRTGDVIFFLQPHGNNYVVHRVVSVTSDGIRTRGDNNKHLDPWVLRSEDIIGQVVRTQRGQKKRAIYGGGIGWIWSLGVRSLRAIDRCISLILRPFYLSLTRSGLVRRWFPLTMRIIALNRPHGRELKLFLGRLIVGRYMPEVAQWQIRRPFRLFIDEKSLPR